MADVPGKFFSATKVRTGVAPSSSGSLVGEPLPPVNPPGSSLNSVGLTMPSAFTVSNSPLTANGTIGVAGAGTVGQYIRGDGSLADFPQASGGGSSVSYYLNGSISQGTIGGVAYKELNKVPILGAGTQFSINADGYIASFLTDAGDPNLLEIPGGNWNFETYFSASSSGGTPTFYVELYKYDGTTFTLIASSSTSPELIAFGTNLNPYFSTLAVPTTTLALTDRLAVRFYVTHSGRTITMHTENNTLCQIVTTFTTGLTSLNGLTAQVQNLAVGTSGTDFNIASATATHTFNLPTASATNRGALSSSDWSTFNNKQNALTNPVTGTGSAGQVAYWSSSSAITGESNLFWDATNDRLGIGSSATPTPVAGVKFPLLVTSDAVTRIRIDSTQATPNAGVGLYANGVQKFSFAMFGTTSDFTIYNDALLSSSILVKGDTNNILINDNNDLGQKLRLGGRFALRASATASATTQVPVFVSDPSSTTTELLTRTPAQFRSDIGAQATLTNPVTGTGTTNYLPKFTGSTTIGNSNLVDVNGYLVLGNSSSAYGQAGRGTFEMNGSSDNIFAMRIGGGLSGYLYTNSSNMELYSTTNIQFSTAGAIRATLFSDGNFTLSNSPSNAGFKLDVNGTGRFSGRLLVSHATSGNYGAVIYNTSATGEGLTVRGGSTSSHSALIIQPYDGSVSLLNILATGAATFNLGSGEMRLNRTGTSEFLKLNTYYLLSDGNDQLLGSVTGATSIYAGNGVSPRLTITSGGNVGIGTTTYSMTAGYTGLGINNATNGGALDLLLNDVKKGELYITSSSFNMYGFAGVGLNLTVDNNSSKGLSIATTGAATFSSSVTAVNIIARRDSTTSGTDAQFISENRTGTSGQYAIYGSRLDNGSGAGFVPVAFGAIQTSGAGRTGDFIIAVSNTDNVNLSTHERMRITSGGNVLIGTTTDNGSKLRVNGSLALPHVTKSANYTLDGTDYTVGFDCASNRTATLPDATTCSGRIYVIYQYNTGSGARSVTLDGNGSQTINGATTYSLYPYCDFTSVMIQSNGSNWIIIASNLTADCL